MNTDITELVNQLTLGKIVAREALMHASTGIERVQLGYELSMHPLIQSSELLHAKVCEGTARCIDECKDEYISELDESQRLGLIKFGIGFLGWASASWLKASTQSASHIEDAVRCVDAALINLDKLDHQSKLEASLFWEVHIHRAEIYAKRTAGDSAENVETVIESYEAAMALGADYIDQEKLVSLQTRLGNAYEDRTRGNLAQNVEQAIKCYTNALQSTIVRPSSPTWASLRANLANALHKRVLGDRLSNLESSLEGYKDYLSVIDEEMDPIDWAWTKRYQGDVYRERLAGEYSDNMECAIECYEEAARVFASHGMLSECLATVQTLAYALVDRVKGDHAQNVAAAIEHLEKALTIVSRDEAPKEWAKIQHALGYVYELCILGDRADNIQKAIECYKAALSVLEQEPFPEIKATVQMSLGNAYVRDEIGNRAENVEIAIGYYNSALTFISSETFSDIWALLMNSLGAAYIKRSRGVQAENIEQALACLSKSLSCRDRNKTPRRYAYVCNNIGTAYTYRLHGDPIENKACAKHYLTVSAEIKEQLGLFAESLDSLRNLIEFYYRIEDWTGVIDLMQWFTDLLKQARSASLSEASQRWLNHKNRFDYDLGMLACIHKDDWEAALIISEKARAGWIHQLVGHRTNLGPVDDEVRGRYMELRQNMLQIQRQARQLPRLIQSYTSNEKLDEIANLRQKLLGMQKSIAAIEDQIHRKYPNWWPGTEALNLSQIRTLAASADSILIQLRVTDEGTLVFIVAPDGQFTHLFLDGFRLEELEHLLARHENDQPVDGMSFHYVRQRQAWLSYYEAGQQRKRKESVLQQTSGSLDPQELEKMRKRIFATWRNYMAERKQWLDCLDQTLGRLYDLVMRPIHRAINELSQATAGGRRRIVLSPSRGLAVLPLHAAWYVVRGQRYYFCDDFEVTYVPSFRMLDLCLDNDLNSLSPASFLAVQNPFRGNTGDLPFADWEAEDIISLHGTCFPEGRRVILDGQKATASKVKQHMPNFGCVLLSTHGKYELLDSLLRSGLLMAGSDFHEQWNGQPDLPLQDILELPLSGVWQVALSACETALMDFRETADEQVSLSTVFLVAGVATVIGNLWVIDDLASALLMRRFHENLFAKGMDKASALGEAQVWLRELPVKEVENMIKQSRGELFLKDRSSQRYSSVVLDEAENYLHVLERSLGDHPFKHPYYWAASQCVGAGWAPKHSSPSSR